MMSAIGSLLVSIFLLLLVLEGFAVMLRGVGVRGSPMAWTGRTVANAAERLITWAFQTAWNFVLWLLRQLWALALWLLQQLGRGLRAALRAWWGLRLTHPRAFWITGAVMCTALGISAWYLSTFL